MKRINAWLGEIHIASIWVNVNGEIKVTASRSANADLIVQNIYKKEEDAKEVVRKLVPEPCREYIRFLEDRP